MHALLYLLTALTFLVGTQLLILAEYTDQFFSWTIRVPMTAAFVGAGFWGAAVVVFWCARQCDWARGRVVIPTVAIVVTMLLLMFISSPFLADSVWPWPLTDLTSKAIGTWLVGTGATCGVVSLLDDRDAMPGWALAQIAFGGAVLLSLLRFSEDVDFGELSAWREGLYAPIEAAGGIPVELRGSSITRETLR